MRAALYIFRMECFTCHWAPPKGLRRSSTDGESDFLWRSTRVSYTVFDLKRNSTALFMNTAASCLSAGSGQLLRLSGEAARMVSLTAERRRTYPAMRPLYLACDQY